MFVSYFVYGSFENNLYFFVAKIDLSCIIKFIAYTNNFGETLEGNGYMFVEIIMPKLPISEKLWKVNVICLLKFSSRNFREFFLADIIRPSDKRAKLTLYFLISHAKHMLWKLKRTISLWCNTPHDNTDLDTTQSCCGSHIF